MIFDVATRGMGDAVYTAWIAAGMIAAGQDCSINAGQNANVCKLFNIPIADEGGIDLCNDEGPCWKYEFRVGGGPIDRPTMWALVLGIKTPIQRPTYTISEWAMRKARTRWGRTHERPRVLLFPRAAWPNRVWPLVHWLRLAWMLEAAGCHTIAMDSNDASLKLFPRYVYGLSLVDIAATMLKADLVVGNESGPAHLAGTLDVPTLGVIGALDPRTIWGHMPSVTPVRTTRTKCVGCHWQPDRGFTPICSKGCESLFLLSADEVFPEAMRILKHEPNSPQSISVTDSQPAQSA